MTPVALLAAFTLMTAAPPPDDGGGEPLPPGAPTEPYELSAWCYGALNEYLIIYDEVKPELRDIDRMFGTSVVEAEPYQSDMAAARLELHMIGGAVTDAEKASPRPIAQRGASAMRQGEGIWSIVETKSRRELARAWMLWALPDRCDSNARDLAQRSLLLGKALSYNAGPHVDAPAPAATAAAPGASALDGADTAQTAPIATPQPNAQPTAEAAPPPAAGDAAAEPPSGDMVPSPTSTAPGEAPAANMTAPNPAPTAAAAPEPSSQPPDVMSALPQSSAPVATAPTAEAPAPDAPSAEQAPPKPPAGAATGADQSQEPTL
jgi:hypothetical protein